MELETPFDLKIGRVRAQRTGLLALAAFVCVIVQVPGSPAQQHSLTDLRDNVARIEVVLKNGETREGFALAVADYLNGILFVVPNTLVRDLTVPDNPTKKVSIRYFSSFRLDDESTLLENSNTRRNVALILAPVRLYNRRFVWNSQGCRNDVAPGARAQFIGVNRVWRVSPAGQFLTAFDDDRAAARIGSANDSAIGAPVIVDAGIVGIIEDSRGGMVRIIDLKTIEATIKAWGLPWTLTSLHACVQTQVSLSELAASSGGLTELVARLYQPGISYVDILTQMRPTDTDFAAIFQKDSAPTARAHYQKILQDFSNSTVTHYGGSEVTIKRCVDIPSGFKGELTLTGAKWRGYAILTKVNTKNCTVGLGATTYKSFWFVNGHWIWLPAH